MQRFGSIVDILFLAKVAVVTFAELEAFQAAMAAHVIKVPISESNLEQDDCGIIPWLPDEDSSFELICIK